MHPVEERFEKYIMPIPETGCWIWTGGTTRGYGRIYNMENGRRLAVPAHRVAWEIYKGKIPESMCVLHRCDVNSCVNPQHLFLGTPIDNSQDRCNKNRQAKGEKINSAKLTEDQVMEIRKVGKSQKDIALDYNVWQTTISAIKTKKTWRHLLEKEKP